MTQKTDNFNKRGTLKRYGYRSCDFNTRSFHLTKKNDSTQKSEPIGDYIILKSDESEDISLKKIENLIQILNEERPSRLKECDAMRTFFERIETEENEDNEETDSSGSGSGAYIMRSLGQEGVTIPEARIMIEDAETRAIFENQLKKYCESLSSDKEFRNTKLYIHTSDTKSDANLRI